MLQNTLGATGLRVSELTLGTASWGEEVDEGTAASMLSTFLQGGGRSVETAAHYGQGRSEAILGAMLGTLVHREDVVLISKAGQHSRENHSWLDCSRRGLLDSLHASLDRLGTDHLDLWLVHAWDERVPLAETLSTLQGAISSGLTRYVGVSNYTGWQLAKAAALCGTPFPASSPLAPSPLAAVQSEYSLLARRAEADVLPAAVDAGVGVLAAASLGGGVLTGKYRGRIPADSRAASSRLADQVAEYLQGRPTKVVEALVTAATGLDRAPLALALAWVLGHDGVASALVAPRTEEQLAQILAADRSPLPPQIAQVLDEVS